MNAIMGNIIHGFSVTPAPKTATMRPMIGAHIARNTQPPTQYLGKGRGFSTYYPMQF